MTLISLVGQKPKSLIQTIKRHELPPKRLSGLFTTQDLDWLREIKDAAYGVKELTNEKLMTQGKEALGKMAHPKGEHHAQLDQFFREKLAAHMEGEFEMSFTFHRNFFPYGIHTDASYESDEYLYKQGIVPLEVFPSDAKVYTVIFQQKSYHSMSYPSDVETIRVLKPEELSVIEGLDKEYKISSEELSRYWQGKKDKERFRGFEIALPFQWKLGDMALWDRAHLHCSSDFVGHGIEGKVGLMWVSRRLS